MPPALAAASTRVREAGFLAPAPAAPHPPRGDGHLRGWQRAAVAACDERALETHLPHLTPASRALLLSQAGLHSGRALTVLPTSAAVALPEHLLVLLLRRLRLPLPLAPRTCHCRGRLDPVGDHRSACATSGALASRALPLEHAVARVCRKSGARVARNVRLADMNIDVPVSDARCIEVVANGLPLWHGTQLAIDATIVSPVTRAGEPQPGAATRPGAAVQAAARRKRRQTYPELASPRVSSLSGSRLAGASVLKPPPSCATSHGTALPASRRRSGPLPVPAGSSAGPARRHVHLRGEAQVAHLLGWHRGGPAEPRGALQQHIRLFGRRIAVPISGLPTEQPDTTTAGSGSTPAPAATARLCGLPPGAAAWG